MALVERGRCTFFIRSVRRGGRVTSEYVGSGMVAVFAHAAALDLQEEREAEREVRREALDGLVAGSERVVRPMRDYWSSAEALFRATMEAAGFRRHKRGEWRRRRMRGDDPG